MGTRLGDRLMDSFALATLFTLNNAAAPCTLHWLPEKAAEFSDTIRVGGCNVVITPTRDWYLDFNHTASDGDCVVRLPDVYSNWTRHGTATPHQLFFSEPARAYMPDNTTESGVAAAFQRVAHTTHSTQFPDVRGNDRWVGVHVRGTDKLVERPAVEDEWFQSMAGFETTFARQKELTMRSLEYMRDELIGRRRSTRFFLASDDEALYTEMADAIEGLGGVVVNRQGRVSSTLGDFFGLAESDMVLQVTRYSTFSMAASLVGRVPVVNFGNSLHTNAERIWQQVCMFDLPYRSW